jgi:hypothetical protein
MRRAVWLTFAVAINAILTTISQAHTNSCISSTDGFWDESRIWSLAKPPSIRQSAILITNGASETVTIDTTTATEFKSTMTVSNLTLSALSGSADTLYLDNTGTIGLHILNSLNISLPPDNSSAGDSELISTNSTLIVDGLLGGQLQDNGTMVLTGGFLITTNCSLYVAGSFGNPYNAVGVLILSNTIVQARDVTIASASPSSGTLELIGGTMTLSASLGIGAGENNARGSLLVANGALLVVTNGGIGSGYGDPRSQSGGSITVTNATILAGGWYASGGNLSIETGTVTLEGLLTLDYGAVSLDGGILVVTNNSTTIGGEEGGGEITIEDGLYFAQTIFVGTEYQSDGILTVYGGSTQLSSNLQIGGFGFSDGGVFLGGGQFVVTNGETMVEVGGSIAVSGGLLAANYITLNDYSFGGGIYNPVTGTLSVPGTLAINGGSVTASTGITLGDCASSFVGQIAMDGGQLIVTNAAGTGFIDVRSGQLVLSNGLLQVDKLVMTNTCSQFIHTGGTLIAGSVVLDPNAFQITSAARVGNDLLVTWLMGPGQTNALQVSSGGAQGSYNTNGFTDIFVVTNNTTAGTLTNYLDIGATTNQPSRYYRARLSL